MTAAGYLQLQADALRRVARLLDGLAEVVPPLAEVSADGFPEPVVRLRVNLLGDPAVQALQGFAAEQGLEVEHRDDEHRVVLFRPDGLVVLLVASVATDTEPPSAGPASSGRCGMGLGRPPAAGR